MTPRPSDTQAASVPDTPPFVSIIMPCRNEIKTVEGSIRTLLSGEQPEGGMELIVADGRSTDGTVELLTALARTEPRLRVIDNPRRITPTGLNACIRASRGRVILRVDAHTQYASDYVVRCVETLYATGADNVGGPWVTVGNTYMEKAVAAALGSPLAVGGARSHNASYEGCLDSVCFGCWHRDIFDRVGLFDEELVRNQDDEHNFRIIRSGGRVWQSPSIRFTYTPRDSLAHLARQYFQYGYWKVRVIQKHGRPASIRHLVPGAYVTTQLTLGLASPFSGKARRAACALAGLYGLVLGVSSVITCGLQREWRVLPVMPAVLASIHLGYGAGFLGGVLDFVLLRKARGRHTSLTR